MSCRFFIIVSSFVYGLVRSSGRFQGDFDKIRAVNLLNFAAAILLFNFIR